MKTHMIGCYVEPVLYYGLETIVLTAQLSDTMKAVLNTARRMILGLRSRRNVKVDELKRKVSIEPVASKLQKMRVNLWSVACISHQTPTPAKCCVVNSQTNGATKLPTSGNGSANFEMMSDIVDLPLLKTG